MAMAPLHPIGVPSRSPRTVSMIGVKGWYSANQVTGPGLRGSRVALSR